MPSGHQSLSPLSPAMRILLDDYARFHWVMVAGSGICALLFGLLGAAAGRRLGVLRHLDASAGMRRYARRFAGLAIVSALGFLLLALVNFGTATSPDRGFSSMKLGSSASVAGLDSSAAALRPTVVEWLASDRSEQPAMLRERVRKRLAWQRPKAIISSIVAVAGLLVLARRLKLRTSVLFQSPELVEPRWRRRVGGTVFPVTVVLLLMAVANSQAVIAPLTITAAFG